MEYWVRCWVGPSAKGLFGAGGAGAEDEELVAGILEAAGKLGPGMNFAAL